MENDVWNWCPYNRPVGAGVDGIDVTLRSPLVSNDWTLSDGEAHKPKSGNRPIKPFLGAYWFRLIVEAMNDTCRGWSDGLVKNLSKR